MEAYRPREYQTLVISHGGCADGMAAAWIFAQRWSGCYFHGAFERDITKDKHMPSFVNKDVYILDFCYPVDVLEQMVKEAKSVTVIDHHKSNTDILAEAKGVKVVFDLTKCGAELTWQYAFPEKEAPWWLVHIADRDLWTWTNANSKAFTAAFFDLGLKFSSFDKINTFTDEEKEKFYARGQSITEFRDTEVKNLVKLALKRKLGSYTVMAVNSSQYRSEVGSALAQMEGIDFGVVYYYDLNTDTWNISLRGVTEKGIDLGKVAKEFDARGGGHMNASGFSTNSRLGELLKEV